MIGPPAASPEEVGRLVDRYPAESPPHGSAGAAVLIVLRSGRTEPEVLLIERAVRAGDPASGQIGLPGGRTHDGDGTLAATALRECEEEVGLGSRDLLAPPRFVGVSFAPAFGLDVGVFCAALGPDPGSPSARSPSEVAHVFWLPRSALSHRQRLSRETLSGAREVEATVHDGHVLWGFTRRILLDFFEVPAEVAPR